MNTINKTNILKADMTTETTSRGEAFTYLDISGSRLGARIEELGPGATSSYHHYHTLEEEHVLVLQGQGTLHTGDDADAIDEGDHLVFEAGRQVGHHIENTSNEVLRFLVYGERNTNDVVVYPRHQTMMIKALGNKLVTYRDVVDS